MDLQTLMEIKRQRGLRGRNAPRQTPQRPRMGFNPLERARETVGQLSQGFGEFPTMSDFENAPPVDPEEYKRRGMGIMGNMMGAGVTKPIVQAGLRSIAPGATAQNPYTRNKSLLENLESQIKGFSDKYRGPERRTGSRGQYQGANRRRSEQENQELINKLEQEIRRLSGG